MLRSRLAMTAVLVLGMGAVSPIQPAPMVRTEAQRPRREMKRYNVTPSSWRHTYLNHGPTAAQVQRAARKARNVKRHKRNVRG
jgi:cbb3-type cytochrome oxidase cytochrome c subunit